jgi:hypothetical protein
LLWSCAIVDCSASGREDCDPIAASVTEGGKENFLEARPLKCVLIFYWTLIDPEAGIMTARRLNVLVYTGTVHPLHSLAGCIF